METAVLTKKPTMTIRPNKPRIPNDILPVGTENPNDMNPTERFSEIAQILRNGVKRLADSERQQPTTKKIPKTKLQTTVRYVHAVPGSVSSRPLLSEDMLADRWLCSASRLQRWRSEKSGPAYLKIGGKILYRMTDIEAYEASMLVLANDHRNARGPNQPDSHLQAEASKSEKSQTS